MILYTGKTQNICRLTEAKLSRDGRLTVSNLEAETVDAQILSETYLNFDYENTERLSGLLGVPTTGLPTTLSRVFTGIHAAERFRAYCEQHDVAYDFGCIG